MAELFQDGLGRWRRRRSRHPGWPPGTRGVIPTALIDKLVAEIDAEAAAAADTTHVAYDSQEAPKTAPG